MKTLEKYQEEFNEQVRLMHELKHGTFEYFKAENKKDDLQRECIVKHQHLLDYNN